MMERAFDLHTKRLINNTRTPTFHLKRIPQTFFESFAYIVSLQTISHHLSNCQQKFENSPCLDYIFCRHLDKVQNGL